GEPGALSILGREGGTPISPSPETPVPASNPVAPDGSAEMASPTQPVCEPGLKFVPMLRPGDVPRVPGAASPVQPIFTPPAKTGTRAAPAADGGLEGTAAGSHPRPRP